MPLVTDDLSHWSDILHWRQHHYRSIVQTYESLANTDQVTRVWATICLLLFIYCTAMLVADILVACCVMDWFYYFIGTIPTDFYLVSNKWVTRGSFVYIWGLKGQLIPVFIVGTSFRTKINTKSGGDAGRNKVNILLCTALIHQLSTLTWVFPSGTTRFFC